MKTWHRAISLRQWSSGTLYSKDSLDSTEWHRNAYADTVVLLGRGYSEECRLSIIKHYYNSTADAALYTSLSPAFIFLLLSLIVTHTVRARTLTLCVLTLIHTHSYTNGHNILSFSDQFAFHSIYDVWSSLLPSYIFPLPLSHHVHVSRLLSLILFLCISWGSSQSIWNFPFSLRPSL